MQDNNDTVSGSRNSSPTLQVLENSVDNNSTERALLLGPSCDCEPTKTSVTTLTTTGTSTTIPSHSEQHKETGNTLTTHHYPIQQIHVAHYYACCPPLEKNKAKHVDASNGNEVEDEDTTIPLYRALLAECLGTAMIVWFGCGSVCSGLTGAYVGIWQTAIVWGIGVTLAILCTAEVSGAHLNPAVTLAFLLVRPQAHQLTATKACLYMMAQLLGGVLGGAWNLVLYSGTLRAYEREHGLVRGQENSILTAAAFGEYFPNPYLTVESGGDHYQQSDVSVAQAVLVEGWGTFLLCAIIFALTHPRNPVLENSYTRVLVPFCIGMTVAMLLALYAPITQAGWNPARDLGPRLVAALAGWGRVAIPGPRNGFWVYIVGPLLGGPLGAAFMEYIVFGTTLDKPMNRIIPPLSTSR